MVSRVATAVEAAGGCSLPAAAHFSSCLVCSSCNFNTHLQLNLSSLSLSHLSEERKEEKNNSGLRGLRRRGRERKEERWMVGSVGTEQPPVLQPPVMRTFLLQDTLHILLDYSLSGLFFSTNPWTTIVLYRIIPIVSFSTKTNPNKTE